jgi:predicted glycosyltransferase involved in capsule biosynthesis
MVYPYDGRFYFLCPELKKLFEEFRDFDLLHYHLKDRRLPHGYKFVGGGFIVNRQSYINAGLENENFTGWGPEDTERFNRWDILGYNIRRIDGPMFHLYHPRFENSYIADDNFADFHNEYFKICKMFPFELKNYINTWPHMIKLKA